MGLRTDYRKIPRNELVEELRLLQNIGFFCVFKNPAMWLIFLLFIAIGVIGLEGSTNKILLVVYCLLGMLFWGSAFFFDVVIRRTRIRQELARRENNNE